jgi:hypothetical protein
MFNYFSLNEKYEQEFIKGYRIGRIRATREILINILRRMGKPSKKIINKINLESDLIFLHLILEYTLNQNINLNDIELVYDKLMRTEKEFIEEKVCSYEKSKSLEVDI